MGVPVRAEPAQVVRQIEVRGPEVVPPFRDTVRFIDDREIHERGLRQRAERLSKLGRLQPFGGMQHELVLTALYTREQASALLAGRQAARDRYGTIDSIGTQALDLVLDQRNERVDDERQARHQEAGELVDEALSGSGREQHHAILLA